MQSKHLKDVLIATWSPVEITVVGVRTECGGNFAVVGNNDENICRCGDNLFLDETSATALRLRICCREEKRGSEPGEGFHGEATDMGVTWE